VRRQRRKRPHHSVTLCISGTALREPLRIGNHPGSESTARVHRVVGRTAAFDSTSLAAGARSGRREPGQRRLANLVSTGWQNRVSRLVETAASAPTFVVNRGPPGHHPRRGYQPREYDRASDSPVRRRAADEDHGGPAAGSLERDGRVRAGCRAWVSSRSASSPVTSPSPGNSR
jgi:hypothetical protein